MIAGFEQPSAGAILLAGKDVTHVAPYDRDVNTVFQDYALFPHMSVRQNVEYGLKVKGVGRTERRRRAAEMLEVVRLGQYGDRRPNQLSGGQRQRVALARALVNQPGVLLLDEPLGALDLKLREEMQVELKSIQHAVGITFVFVTHDQGEALSMSTRIAVFNDGRIEQVGTPAGDLRPTGHVVRRRLRRHVQPPRRRAVGPAARRRPLPHPAPRAHPARSTAVTSAATNARPPAPSSTSSTSGRSVECGSPSPRVDASSPACRATSSLAWQMAAPSGSHGRPTLHCESRHSETTDDDQIVEVDVNQLEKIQPKI